jgi:hypothetical protein
MPEEKDEIASEAKSLSGQLVELFGLKEIIFGALIVYCFWVPRREALAYVFPGTGKGYVDVILLAFASAVIGLLLFFAVAMVWAVLTIVLVGPLRVRNDSPLRQLLRSQLLRAKSPDDTDAFLHNLTAGEATDVAVATVVRIWPGYLPLLTRPRTAAQFAYACAIVAVPILGRLNDVLGFGGWFPFGIATLFLVLGILQQLNYVDELRNALLAASLQPPSKPDCK